MGYGVLRKKRKEVKMTLQELSEIISVDRATIGRWERGKSDPTLCNFRKWCKALGCSPAVVSENETQTVVEKL